MKRDLDLIKSIMQGLEGMTPGKTIAVNPAAFEPEPVVVVEHLRLLVAEGLLEGSATPVPGHVYGGMNKIKAITWAGHDFIDASRDPETWDKAKSILQKLGSYTFSMVVETLKGVAQQRLAELL